MILSDPTDRLTAAQSPNLGAPIGSVLSGSYGCGHWMLPRGLLSVKSREVAHTYLQVSIPVTNPGATPIGNVWDGTHLAAKIWHKMDYPEFTPNFRIVYTKCRGTKPIPSLKPSSTGSGWARLCEQRKYVFVCVCVCVCVFVLALVSFVGGVSKEETGPSRG